MTQDLFAPLQTHLAPADELSRLPVPLSLNYAYGHVRVLPYIPAVSKTAGGSYLIEKVARRHSEASSRKNACASPSVRLPAPGV
jgi:hypothetical protein